MKQCSWTPQGAAMRNHNKANRVVDEGVVMRTRRFQDAGGQRDSQEVEV